MASGDEEMDKIVKILKSLIVPVKGGLPLHQLEREYKLNEGRPIPLAKYGFANITALVQSIPEIRLSANGILTVQSATLAHLTDLVARQRSNKPKSKKLPRLPTARTYGARPPSYSTRPGSYSSGGTPVRRFGVQPRSFNTPSTNRSLNVPPRFTNTRPIEQQPITAKSTLGKPQKPRSTMTYNTDQPRQLPTVVYPGKKSEPDPTQGASSDKQVNGNAGAKSGSVSHRQDPSANAYRSNAESSATEPSRHNGHTSSKPESAAHRLVTAALGYRRKPEDSGSNSFRGGRGDGPDESAPSQAGSLKSQVLHDYRAENAYQYQPSTTTFHNSAGVNSDSSSDQLSALLAEIQIKKAPSYVGNGAYPSTTQPSAGPVYSDESAAAANQKAFLMGLSRLRLVDTLSAPATKPKPALAAWDPVPVFSPLTSPTSPELSGVPKPWDTSASVPQAAAWDMNPSPLSVRSPTLLGDLKLWDSGNPRSPVSPPAEPIGARLGMLQDTQLRGPPKPLKPMDRLLPQNIDNAESVRARLTLEQEVERERLRSLGLSPTLEAPPPPRASYAPAASVPTVSDPAIHGASNAIPHNSSNTPLHVICNWERQSALMMIKPLYNNAQFIGDNLLMQVAKLGLGLEHQFVRAEGVPYRLGLCVSGLTLEQARVEVRRQRAVFPTLVVCLGSIDILMNCELSDICRHMLEFLRSLTEQALLVQRVYVCNLPALPTATPIQRETLVEFNRWLAKFCSESHIFKVCDIFSTFLDEEYHVCTQLYAPPVRVNMGGDCIVQLQPWSKLGCKAFLDTLLASLTSRQ